MTWQQVPEAKDNNFKSSTGSYLANVKLAAEFLDAAAFVETRLSSYTIVNIPISTRDVSSLQKVINSKLAESGVPQDQAFVYVSWGPHNATFWGDYYYIGKGARYSGNATRLELARHGKLAHSIHFAHYISILFVNGGEDERSGLEGSLISLVQFVTGRKPASNDKPVRVPEGPGAKRIKAIASYLEDVIRKLILDDVPEKFPIEEHQSDHEPEQSDFLERRQMAQVVRLRSVRIRRQESGLTTGDSVDARPRRHDGIEPTILRPGEGGRMEDQALSHQAHKPL